MKIDKNKFWSSNYYNNPTLTNDAIKIAETELEIILPELLIELLRIQNGGYTHRFAFPMTQKTTRAEDHVPLYALFGIVHDKGIRTFHNIMSSEYMTKEWGLPPRQVLLNGEGHWWITLDYRAGDKPTVR